MAVVLSTAEMLVQLVALLGTAQVTDWETEFITYVRDHAPNIRQTQVIASLYTAHFGG